MSAPSRPGILCAVLVAALCPLVEAQTPRPAGKRTAPARRRPAPAQSFDQVVAAAAAARDQSNLEEAIRLYGEAVRLRPSWTEGHWYVGTLLYDLDRYDAAREAFRRVVAAEAKNAPAWALKGLCEFQLRNYERALVDIQRARLLGLDERQDLASVTDYHAAILFTRFEHFESAYEALLPFARRGHDRPSIIEALGLSTLRLPFLPAEVPPDKRELVLMAGRAAYHMAARRKEAARKAFDEILSRYPTAPNVHYALGVFLLNEEPDAALEQFRQELRISPTHVQAMLQIAFEHIKRAEYQEALAHAQGAVELAPNQHGGRNALGRALLELGQTDRAIHELEAGVKLAPEVPEMRFALARAYTRAGRATDAARERAEFLRLDKMYRELKSGPQAVGGIIDKSDGERPN